MKELPWKIAMVVAMLSNDTEGNRGTESGKAETGVGIALRSAYAQRE
jgi:hypothetical protein